MDLEYPDSHDLNFSNRPVRTRMPGGVAGAQSMMTAPNADGFKRRFRHLPRSLLHDGERYL